MMFSGSCENKNSGKGDKIIDIQRFHQTTLMDTIDKPYIRKEIETKNITQLRLNTIM